MVILKTILTVLEVIASIALVVVVLFQSGKEAGLGAIAGNSDTYMSRSKFGSMDKVLTAATKWIALAWIVLALSLSLF